MGGGAHDLHDLGHVPWVGVCTVQSLQTSHTGRLLNSTSYIDDVDHNLSDLSGGHTIPHHTIPYHAIPYHTMPYHTKPYHTIPYHTCMYQTYHTSTHQRSPSFKIFSYTKPVEQTTRSFNLTTYQAYQGLPHSAFLLHQTCATKYQMHPSKYYIYQAYHTYQRSRS